jgi:gas vesicle protein
MGVIIQDTRDMVKNKESGALLLGIVVGGLVGTVTGLLIAPRSGRETQRILRKSADALPEIIEDVLTSLELQKAQLSESAQQNWQETLSRLQMAIAAGVEASQWESSPSLEPRDITPKNSSGENF